MKIYIEKQIDIDTLKEIDKKYLNKGWEITKIDINRFKGSTLLKHYFPFGITKDKKYTITLKKEKGFYNE